MPTITIRALSEEAHRALRRRAAEHSRSIEAEVSAILEEAVRPATRVKWGSALVAAFAAGDAGDLDITRDSTPAEGADLA